MLNQIHSVHTVPPFFPKIRSNIISHLRLGLQSGLFASDLPTKTVYAFLIFAMRTTCSAHLILVDLVTLIVLYFGLKSYQATSTAAYCLH